KLNLVEVDDAEILNARADQVERHVTAHAAQTKERDSTVADPPLKFKLAQSEVTVQFEEAEVAFPALQCPVAEERGCGLIDQESGLIELADSGDNIIDGGMRMGSCQLLRYL